MRTILYLIVNRYWPEERQRRWLKGIYHHILAHYCVQMPYDPDFCAAMMEYNLLDILRAWSFEYSKAEFPCGHTSITTVLFFALCRNLLCFQKSKKASANVLYGWWWL